MSENAVVLNRSGGCLSRLWSLVYWGITLSVLGALIWTILSAVALSGQRSQSESTLSARQEAYAATATSLSQVQSSNRGSVRWVAQFATNTPAGAPEPVIAATATPEPLVQEAISTPIPLPTFFRPQDATIAEIAGTAVPTQVPLIPRDYELVNILLLGTDDEVSQDTTIRTDTMIIVSINTETRSVAMLSLPRDLFVYIPTPTMQRLNTVYGIGEAFGWAGGGFGLLRQTIFYNFGIQVHYFARVNFTGFETIIDTLGGIDIAVDCDYQDYYPVEDFDPTRTIEENYALRTLPVGYYTLDGFDALWYARTRRLATDFDRNRRQQQLLRAIFRKALDTGQIVNLPSLWGQITSVVETDVPFDVALGLLPIALDLDPSRIASYTMVRTYHTTPWQPPDGQNVQLPNYEPIRQLLTDFYRPPTSSQIELAGLSIAIYNGSERENLDRVASERLRTVGLNAYAAGVAEQQDYTASTLIDYTGQTKGSLLDIIGRELNITAANVRIEPSVDRTSDYAVIVGANYNSCPGGVLPVDES